MSTDSPIAPACPAPAFPSGEPDRSLRMSIIEGNLEGSSLAITNGALLTGFALMLGATEFHLGLVSALMGLSVIGNLPAAWLIGRLHRRKPLIAITYGFSRLVWVFLGCIPFLPLSQHGKLLLFLGVLLLSGICGSLSGGAWLSWMTDLVPPERRGRYFALRNTINGLFQMAVGYGASWLFDWMKTRDMEATAFALLFGSAACLSMLAIVAMCKQWEPELRGEPPTPVLRLLSQPFRNAGFRQIILFSAAWSAVTSVAAPFFAAHMISNLGMSYSTIAIYSVVGGLITAMVQPLWGKAIDRCGSRPVLVLTLVVVALSPLCWLVARQGLYWPLWVDAVVASVFGPGFGLALFSLVLAAAPEENRMAYLGVQTVVPSVVTMAGSLLGGWLAHAMHAWTWHAFGQTFVNFHLIFVLTILGRLTLIPLAHRLTEARAHSIAVLLGLVRDKVQYALTSGLESGAALVKRGLGR
ncbi:MAG: MFS transporter [Lentisphaerae bacterium]|nr:MFS transporter [Lentisphaerota bacterium]